MVILIEDKTLINFDRVYSVEKITRKYTDGQEEYSIMFYYNENISENYSFKSDKKERDLFWGVLKDALARGNNFINLNKLADKEKKRLTKEEEGEF